MENISVEGKGIWPLLQSVIIQPEEDTAGAERGENCYPLSIPTAHMLHPRSVYPAHAVLTHRFTRLLLRVWVSLVWP